MDEIAIHEGLCLTLQVFVWGYLFCTICDFLRSLTTFILESAKTERFKRGEEVKPSSSQQIITKIKSFFVRVKSRKTSHKSNTPYAGEKEGKI